MPVRKSLQQSRWKRMVVCGRVVAVERKKGIDSIGTHGAAEGLDGVARPGAEGGGIRDDSQRSGDNYWGGSVGK